MLRRSLFGPRFKANCLSISVQRNNPARLPKLRDVIRTLFEQVIEGLDKVVMSMKKGEVEFLTISPEYAFGSSEIKEDMVVVPPNSIVYYEAEIVSFVKESWDMKNDEKIEVAFKKKEEGNTLFKPGKYARASKRYEKGDAFSTQPKKENCY